MKRYGFKFLIALVLAAVLVLQMVPVYALTAGSDSPAYEITATSEAAGHAAESAADGNAATYWMASENDKEPPRHTVPRGLPLR